MKRVFILGLLFMAVVCYGQSWSWKDTITQGIFGVLPATSTINASGQAIIKGGKFTDKLYLGADDTLGSGLSKITLESATGNIMSSNTVTIGGKLFIGGTTAGDGTNTYTFDSNIFTSSKPIKSTEFNLTNGCTTTGRINANNFYTANGAIAKLGFFTGYNAGDPGDATIPIYVADNNAGGHRIRISCSEASTATTYEGIELYNSDTNRGGVVYKNSAGLMQLYTIGTGKPLVIYQDALLNACTWQTTGLTLNPQATMKADDYIANRSLTVGTTSYQAGNATYGTGAVVSASTGTFTVLKSSASTGVTTVLGFGTNAPTASTTPDKWIFISDVESNIRYCVPAFIANK